MTLTESTPVQSPSQARPRRQVTSRDGTMTGHFTGGQRSCSAFCSGVKHAVRWPDGRLTYVCDTDLTETGTNSSRLTPRNT